jgi:perosamine synthetase
MDELCERATARDLRIIEDAAEAHGAEYRGRRVGGLGDMGTFSFYGNKIITTGEGGAITTNSDTIAQRARFLRDHGMSPERRYWHSEVGYNYRLTNLQAALGYAQMGRIDEFLSKRNHILERYRRGLQREGFTLNPHVEGCMPVNWITCLLVDGFDRSERDRLIVRMREKGVDSRPFFYPLTSLPMYAGSTDSVSERLSATGLNLPTFPELTDSEIDLVCETVVESVDEIVGEGAVA